MALNQVFLLRIFAAAFLWFVCVLSIFWDIPGQFANATSIGGYNLRSLLLFPIYAVLSVVHWIGIVVLPLWIFREFHRRRRT